MSLLPGIRLPKTGFIDWLLGRKETIHLHFTPYTEEQKAAMEAHRKRVDEEIKNSGLAHEQKLTFPVQGKYLFEVVPCTHCNELNGKFTYFIYDCTETKLSALEGEFLDCNTLSSQEKAIEAGYKHAEWLIFLLEDE